jgi:TolB-like protein
MMMFVFPVTNLSVKNPGIKKKTALLCVLIFLVAMTTGGSAYPAEKMAIAILDLTPKGVPAIVSGAVSDIIRAEFSNFANFTVVERNQVNKILNEQGFQMTGCTDTSCAVEVGKLLSARRIIAGEVTAVGKKIVITVRYLDVEKGTSLFSEAAACESLDVIDKTASDVARRFAERIVAGDSEVIIPKTKIGYYTRGIVPGWGQLYVGNNGKAYAFFGALGLSCGFTGYATYNYFDKKSIYENQDPPQSKIDSTYKEYDGAVSLLNYSLITLAAVFTMNYLDIVFFSSVDLNVSVQGPGSAAINVIEGDGSFCLKQKNVPDYPGDVIYISAWMKF